MLQYTADCTTMQLFQILWHLFSLCTTFPQAPYPRKRVILNIKAIFSSKNQSWHFSPTTNNNMLTTFQLNVILVMTKILAFYCFIILWAYNNIGLKCFGRHRHNVWTCFLKQKKKISSSFWVFYVVRHAWRKPNPNTDIRCWSESGEWPRKQPQNEERHLQTITQKGKHSAPWLHHILWDYNSSVIGVVFDFLCAAISNS